MLTKSLFDLAMSWILCKPISTLSIIIEIPCYEIKQLSSFSFCIWFVCFSIVELMYERLGRG